MKKFTAILVAIVLALFVVSCGGGSNDKEKDDSDNTEVPDGEEHDGETPENPDEEDPDGDQGTEVVIDESYGTVAPAYDEYFTFRGGSKMYDPEDNGASAAKVAKFKLSLGGKEITGQSQSYFMYGAVYGAQYGDYLNISTYVYDASGYPTYDVETTVQSGIFDWLEANGVNESPLGAEVVIRKMSDFKVSGNSITYFKSCLLAISNYAASEYVENNGEAPVGEFQYSAPDGVAANKIMNIGLNASINSGEAYILSLLNGDKKEGDEGYYATLADACQCADLTIQQYVECETAPVDEGCEDPNAEKNAAGECVCKEGYEEKEGKCEAKAAEETDPCKDVTCPTAGDVCVADTTAEAGYKCEAKAVCDAEKNEVLNEKTNKCDCKEGYELKEGKCEQKEVANPDKAACEAESGTWTAANTCDCGANKTWDATEKKCKAATPVNPDKALCESTEGTWADNACTCGTGKEWDATEGCKASAPVNPDKTLCESTDGIWADTACDCGTDKEWDATEGCKDNTPEPNPEKEACDAYLAATWNEATEECECDEPDYDWNGAECTPNTPEPNPAEELCNSTGGSWITDTCNCGENTWDDEAGCQAI